MEMRGLIQKRVFVSGGASGIGHAIVDRLLNEKSIVFVMDRNCEESHSENVSYLKGDVTDLADLARLKDFLAEKRVDVIVNNAGITRDSTIFKMTDEQWSEVINTNLTAVYRVSQIGAELLRNQGTGGAIINMASVVAHYGNFGQANYVASKAGVIGLTKTLAKELAKYNIRVNAVAPGFIATEMVQKMPEKVVSMMIEKTPLRRLGTPGEIAALIAFLASDESQYITGACINADGGVTL